MGNQRFKPTSKQLILNTGAPNFEWKPFIQENYKEHLAAKEAIFDVVQKAAKNVNQPAYVIGGWVRDLILQRPSKDVDIVTVGSGIDLAKAVAELRKNFSKVSYFKNFGTAMIRFEDWEVEFVGARKESYDRKSRNPIVENGTLEDDQNRRDFTINALSISLNEENYGQLIDPFNGIQDLKDGIIRTPLDPDITYSDDPLRMMRAIRFAAQLGFEIEENSFNAIRKNKDRIKIVSQERITDEFNKILLSPKPSIGLAALFHTGILQLIFPELCDLQGVEEINGQRHKDNFFHTLEVVDNIATATDNVYLIYAALLHDIGKAKTKRFDSKVGYSFHGHEFLGSKMIPRIFKRMRLPQNEQMRYVRKLVAMSARPSSLVDEEVTDSGVRRLLFDAGDDIDDLMTLCEADVTTKNSERMHRYLNNYKMVRERMKEVEEKDHVRNFQPPVDGDEIIQFFNLKPGPEIGKLKNLVKEAILEGEIQNEKEEAWTFLKNKAKEMGIEPPK